MKEKAISIPKKIIEVFKNRRVLYDIESIFLLMLPILITLDKYVKIAGTILTGVPFVLGILIVVIYQKRKRLKYLLIGILLLANSFLTYDYYEQFEYIKPLMLFFTCFDIAQDMEFLKVLKEYFVKYYKFLMISIGAILSLNLIFEVFNIEISSYTSKWGVDAFEGLFSDPHQAAYRLCTIIIYIMFLIKAKKNSKADIINAIFLIVSEYLILKTAARIPTVLGIALGMIAIYFMKDEIVELYKSHKKVFIIVALIVVAAIAVYLPQSSFVQKSIVSAQGTFDNGRTVLRNVALDYYKQSHILNKLFGNDINEIYNMNSSVIHARIWSHSDMIQVLLEFGTIMLILYLATIIVAYINNLKKQSKFDKFIITLLYLVFLIVAFYNGLGFMQRYIVSIPILFMIYKLYNIEEKVEDKKAEKKTQKKDKKVVLNLLASCGTGGIEVLIRDFMKTDLVDNRVCAMFEEGNIYDEIKNEKPDKIFSLKSKNRNKKAIVDELEKYCIENDVDIVTVHNGGTSCNIIYLMLKQRLPDLKYVRYFHSSYDKYWEGRNNIIKDFVIKRILQKAINNSDLLIFISKAVKTTFNKNFKLKNKKSVVIYNGINKQFFESKHNKEKTKNSLVYVGRLEKEKGIDLLIEAFEKIYEKHKDCKLTIIGSGREENNLKEKAQSLECANNIVFAGRQNNVVEWLDESDIFVYPSIWEEGFGISVLEAMSRGCIPVTFNKGGLKEIISNGKNGFTVKNTNSNDLADAILKIIEMNEYEKQIIIDEALKTAKQFTIEETVQSLAEQYNGLE